MLRHCVPDGPARDEEMVFAVLRGNVDRRPVAAFRRHPAPPEAAAHFGHFRSITVPFETGGRTTRPGAGAVPPINETVTGVNTYVTGPSSTAHRPSTGTPERPTGRPMNAVAPATRGRHDESIPPMSRPRKRPTRRHPDRASQSHRPARWPRRTIVRGEPFGRGPEARNRPPTINITTMSQILSSRLSSMNPPKIAPVERGRHRRQHQQPGQSGRRAAVRVPPSPRRSTTATPARP